MPNNKSQFETFLSERLKEPLPGMEAQKLLQPTPLGLRHVVLKYKELKNNFKNSGVLVPILDLNGSTEVILTLRTDTIAHGGQISFPGGRCERNENFTQTALREAKEEIGLDEKNVDIVGRLSTLFIDHSRNKVEPVVGFIREEQPFVANPDEVEEIFTVSFDELLERRNFMREKWELHNTNYLVPYWDVHRVPLWGATAMMMSELVELYKEFLAASKS